MEVIDKILILLAILIISTAITIFLTYSEEYKDIFLIITSISGTILSIITFLRNRN